MTATASAPPLILIAAIPEHSLASVFQGRHYAVVQVHTATLAAEWVRDVRPDMIIIDAELPDMSGIDACRLLHSDPRIGHTVPTLILAPNKPTPERSEEHTSELQSRLHLVCRLLLEKKKTT